MARDRNVTLTINKDRRLQKELIELSIKYEKTKADLANANSCLEVYAKEKEELSLQNEELRKQIDELEAELRVKEDLFAIKDAISQDPCECARASIKWYEDRYQSDCITINQLHTTIDVLTDKLARLRGQMGL